MNWRLFVILCCCICTNRLDNKPNITTSSLITYKLSTWWLAWFFLREIFVIFLILDRVLGVVTLFLPSSQVSYNLYQPLVRKCHPHISQTILLVTGRGLVHISFCQGCRLSDSICDPHRRQDVPVHHQPWFIAYINMLIFFSTFPVVSTSCQ